MLSILLIEDDADQRRLYHDVLLDAGFQVLEAASGVEAMQAFKRTKPDLVVLDIQMPGMDGIEALGKLLAQDRTVPVILYTAYPAFKQNFMTWTADAFLEKSGDPAELIAEVRKLAAERGLSLPDPVKTVDEKKNP